jgi:hypothetical protein
MVIWLMRVNLTPPSRSYTESVLFTVLSFLVILLHTDHIRWLPMYLHRSRSVYYYHSAILTVQWKPLNVITLVQRQSDNINRMITLSENTFLSQFTLQLENWLLACVLVSVKATRIKI